MSDDAHALGQHVPSTDEHDEHRELVVTTGHVPSPAPLVVPRWLARTWVGGGVLGIVVATLGGILGTAFVGTATGTAVEALGVTEAVLSGVDDTTTVLDRTFTNVTTTLRTVEGTITDTATTVDAVGTTLDDLTMVVTQDVPDSLDAINDAMPQLVRTADVIDSTMRTLSFIGVDYDPAAPLDQSLDEVRRQLAGIPPDLRQQREGMEEVGTRLDALADQSDDIATDLETISTDLRESQALLQDYRATADQATVLVGDLAGRLETQARTARILIVLLALAVAIAQTVPLVLGLQALRTYAPDARLGAGVR